MKLTVIPLIVGALETVRKAWKKGHGELEISEMSINNSYYMLRFSSTQGRDRFMPPPRAIEKSDTQNGLSKI